MGWGDFHSGGLNRCGRGTWTCGLILRIFGVIRAKVVEKLKIRRCSG